MLRNGKCKRTVEEQQAAANDQKRAALGDISNNKDMQRCEQVRPLATGLTGRSRARGRDVRVRPWHAVGCG